MKLFLPSIYDVKMFISANCAFRINEQHEAHIQCNFNSHETKLINEFIVSGNQHGNKKICFHVCTFHQSIEIFNEFSKQLVSLVIELNFQVNSM